LEKQFITRSFVDGITGQKQIHHVKENEIGRACRTHRRENEYVRDPVRKTGRK
jgi:hypothetical protein